MLAVAGFTGWLYARKARTSPSRAVVSLFAACLALEAARALLRAHVSPAVRWLPSGALLVLHAAALPIACEAAWRRREPMVSTVAALLAVCAWFAAPRTLAPLLPWVGLPASAAALVVSGASWRRGEALTTPRVVLLVLALTELGSAVAIAGRWDAAGWVAQGMVWSWAMLAVSGLHLWGVLRREAAS